MVSADHLDTRSQVSTRPSKILNTMPTDYKQCIVTQTEQYNTKFIVIEMAGSHLQNIENVPNVMEHLTI